MLSIFGGKSSRFWDGLSRPDLRRSARTPVLDPGGHGTVPFRQQLVNNVVG